MNIALLQISDKKLNFSILFFFDNQCSLINNNSNIPTDSYPLTDKFLSNVTFTNDDAVKVVIGLKPSKALGYNMISICMKKRQKFNIETLRTYLSSLFRSRGIS